MIARTKMPDRMLQKAYDTCREQYELGNMKTHGSNLSNAFWAGLMGRRNILWQRGSICWAAYHAGRDLRGEINTRRATSL
jgi:hypothetical protein